jgi:ubiquinone/menaquinone biosynthesis C-methylase UbiE
MPLRIRLRWLLFHTKYMDSLLKRRAEDLVDRLEIPRHLPDAALHVDIGSGAGHLVERLALHGGRPTLRLLAIDPVWVPTPRVQRRIRRKAPDRVLFLRGDGARLPVADASLDGVSVLFVLHHVPADVQEQILDEIQRVLKPQGMLFLVEDTPETEQERLATDRWDRRVNFEPRHETHAYRNAAQWRNLLQQKNFHILAESEFHDRSPRDSLIRHTAFVCRQFRGSLTARSRDQ